MLPANKRLHTNNILVFRAKLRLVIQDKLPLLKRMSQLLFTVQIVRHCLRHLRLVECVAVPPEAFRRIHSSIRHFYQVVLVVGIRWIDTDTDATAWCHLILAKKHRLVNRFDYLSAQRLKVIGSIKSIDNNYELVPADPAQRIRSPQHRLQAICYGTQHLVSNLMAQCVIDSLEVIEVDEKYSQPAFRPRSMRNRHV